MISSKVCSRCKERKPGDEFSTTNNRSSDGLTSWCLACCRSAATERRKRDPQAMRDARNRYRDKPGERERDRLRMRAKDRARRRLAERHSEEYADLLDEERAALGLPPAQRRRLVG